MRFSLKTLLAVFVSICAGIGQSHAADLMYVSHGSSILTYDVSLTSATAIANSKQTFATANNFRGLSFDTGGNLYAANTSSVINQVNKYSSTGVLLNTIGSSANLNYPEFIALDQSNNSFVSNFSSGQISRFNSDGSFQSYFGSSNNRGGLAFDSSGKLFASDRINNSINKYDSSGVVVATIGSVLNLMSPTQVTIDTSGNIYVGSGNGNHNISMFDASGVFQKYIVSDINADAYTFGFDSYRNIYMRSSDESQIRKYDSSGNFVLSWSAPGSYFFAFAPTSVPEPSTYALAAIASILMALSIRRRNRSKVCLIDL